MKSCPNRIALALTLVVVFACAAVPAMAETRTVSWNKVSQYTDNTVIPSSVTESYAVYWTTESSLSPAFAWPVPVVALPPPTAPTLTGLVITGPVSVNEGATGAYTSNATWSDTTTTSVTPAAA